MSKTTACHDRCKAPAQGSVKKVARAAWKKNCMRVQVACYTAALRKNMLQAHDFWEQIQCHMNIFGSQRHCTWWMMHTSKQEAFRRSVLHLLVESMPKNQTKRRRFRLIQSQTLLCVDFSNLALLLCKYSGCFLPKFSQILTRKRYKESLSKHARVVHEGKGATHHYP